MRTRASDESRKSQAIGNYRDGNVLFLYTILEPPLFRLEWRQRRSLPSRCRSPSRARMPRGREPLWTLHHAGARTSADDPLVLALAAAHPRPSALLGRERLPTSRPRPFRPRGAGKRRLEITSDKVHRALAVLLLEPLNRSAPSITPLLQTPGSWLLFRLISATRFGPSCASAAHRALRRTRCSA